MKALNTRLQWVLKSSMTLLFVCLSLNISAQTDDTKTVIITTKKLDKNGEVVVEKRKLKGTDASEEAIEKLIQEAVGAGKSVDVEIEESMSSTNKKDAEQLMKTYAITLDGDADTDTEITMEIETDEETGDTDKAKKIQKKEVRIIKMKGDGKNIDLDKLLKEHDIDLAEEGKGEKKEIRIRMESDEEDIDINELLKEHDIDLEDGAGTKEIRIIKMKGDGEDVDVDELLKEHNIDLEDGGGKKKQVKIIKMKGDKNGTSNKGASNKEVRIIKMKDGKEIEIEEEHEIYELSEDGEENVFIFQGEDGTTQVIKKNKKEVLDWTQREDVEEKLTKMGIVLPKLGAPVANYVHAVRSDKLIFLAGKGPKKSDGTYIKGKLGRDLTVKEGYEAARLTGILQLAALKAEIGDLNRVKRIVKVLGMVNCTADFGDQPEVINGFSDLMVEVFGERGKHARAAVGMYALPRNTSVEIEMVVEIE